MQIKDEFVIESLQKFEQYSKINPISVQIIDSDLQTKLRFHSKNINIDLLLTLYYLVRQLNRMQVLFLLLPMG